MTAGFFGALPGAWAAVREHIPPDLWKLPEVRWTDLRWAEDCVRFSRPFPGDHHAREKMPALAFFAKRWGVSNATVTALRDNRERWADPIWLQREAEGKATPPTWTGRKGGRKKKRKLSLELKELQATRRPPAPRPNVERLSREREANVDRTWTERRGKVEAPESTTKRTWTEREANVERTPQERGPNASRVELNPRAITDHPPQDTFTSTFFKGGSGDRGRLIVLEPPTRRRPPARPGPEGGEQAVLPEQTAVSDPAPVVPAPVVPAPGFPRLRAPEADLHEPRRAPQPELSQGPPAADSEGGRLTADELGQMAARCWQKVFQAPVPLTRKDRSVLAALAARYGHLPLTRLEKDTETYLRACQTGADWPKDPHLVNLQAKLDRYLMLSSPPAAQGEPESDGWVYDDAPAEPETGDDSDALAGGGFSLAPPEVMAAAAALFHHDPGQRETPPTSVLLWWKEHDPQTYQAALKAVDSIEHDAGVGVLYG